MLRRLLWLLPLLAVICLAQPGMAAASVRHGDVDPRVWGDLAQHASAPVLVRLVAQPAPPDLVLPHKLLQDPALERIARQMRTGSDSQLGLRARLDELDLPFRAFWAANAIAVEVTPQLLAELATRPDVIAIESDASFTVPLETTDLSTASSGDPTSIEPGLSLVHAPELWAKGITGQNIVVANADTGVMWTHPALQPQYRGWDGSTANHNYNWWDGVRTEITPSTNPCGVATAVPCDDYGHGTHTTGIAVGSDGATNQVGMAPGAKWIACRNMESGVGRPSTYIACLQFFIAPTDLAGNNPNPALRPDVISNSYGCTDGETCTAHSLTATLQVVRDAGIFISASAGNTGPNCDTIKDPPGADAQAFTVGGTYTNGSMWFGSSRGLVKTLPGGTIKPDVVAPAYDIRSTTFDGGYGYKTGTSMAAPHVAGGVTLLWSAFPALRRDVSGTEALLRRSAVALPVTETCGGLPANAVPNYTSGWGLLNVLRAYQLQLPKVYLPIVDSN